MMIIDGSLRADLAILGTMSDRQARLNAFLGAVRSGDGYLHLPIDDTTWGPGVVEVRYRGIFASGATAEQALAEWLKCANRVIEAEQALITATGTPADLQDACHLVRTRSSNPAALTAARRVQSALTLGLQ